MDSHEKYLSYPTQSTSSTDQHNTTSANLERVVTVSSNSDSATVTINNNDTTAPVNNPPTGVQPVMYSKVAGDITKVCVPLPPAKPITDKGCFGKH